MSRMKRDLGLEYVRVPGTDPVSGLSYNNAGLIPLIITSDSEAV